MSIASARLLSLVAVIAEILSITASSSIWFLYKASDAPPAERFGLFAGLWAPTFIALARWIQTRFSQPAVGTPLQ